MPDPSDILARLLAVIEDRKARPAADSYTSRLLARGVAKIGDKILEEAGEVVDAARGGDGSAGRQHFVHECADLVYHLLVLMAHQQVSLSEVEAELARRFGTSGLAEKAARNSRQNHE
jgi:phosphoribosyl-ATP pyrophosphohydrolase